MDYKSKLRLHNFSQTSVFILINILIILIQLQIIKCYDELDESTDSDYSQHIDTTTIINSNRKIDKSVTTITSESRANALKQLPVTEALSTKLHKRAGNLPESKIQKTIEVIDFDNHSREALSHDENRDHIVYLSDSTGYAPITTIRDRPDGLPSPILTPIRYHNIPPPLPPSSSNDLDNNWRPELWDRDYNLRYKQNTTRVQHIEAECQDDYMKIRIGFNGSFTGLLYSAGYAYDPDCMYINGSGRDYYEFYIQLNRCGTLGKNALHEKTRESPSKNFMWNTITVQYNPLIEEEFDEHFKVTCEYGYDFWKTVTFPFLDVEVATGNPVVFTLSPPECYMEIRNGYGVAGPRVSGPVRVGDPLTLMIYMRSKYDGFDVVVNECYAHNGATKRIQLIDEYGCPKDDKLISRFRGSWSDNGVYETQIYAYMKTFRFTGSPALYIECDVRMCHGRCPSQPCHWRNLKTISKREISNKTKQIEKREQSSLSDNISLFQALQVLQESDENMSAFEKNKIHYKDYAEDDETCIRTSTLSIFIAGLSILLCILTISLLITWSKLQHRHKDKQKEQFYRTYVNHKRQYDQ